MTEWQDISTAPKDGRTILVFGMPTDLVVSGDTLVHFNYPGAFTAAWDQIDDAFSLSGGSWMGPFFNKPTHWMPLPSPPEPPK